MQKFGFRVEGMLLRWRPAETRMISMGVLFLKAQSFDVKLPLSHFALASLHISTKKIVQDHGTFFISILTCWRKPSTKSRGLCRNPLIKGNRL